MFPSVSCMATYFVPEPRGDVILSVNFRLKIQYNTIELYCPVNGKFVCSVRVKVNKNTIVIKKEKNKST